jgi:hypothetical protein
MLTFMIVTALCIFVWPIFLPLTIGYLIGGPVLAIVFLVLFWMILGALQ